MKPYQTPILQAVSLNPRDVIAVSGDNWSNEPDYPDDPSTGGGVNAGGQIGDDFWEDP